MMNLAALIIFLSCSLNFVLSTILSPLLDFDGDIILYENESLLDRATIENSLESENLNSAPDSYKEFITFLFTQPLFKFSDFMTMIENRLVSPDIAETAFARFSAPYDGPDSELAYDHEDLGIAVTKYFKSFDGFQEQFVQICDTIAKANPSEEYNSALFQLVEELQGDFKKCLTEKYVMYVFRSEDESLNRPYMYCFTTMMELDWFTPLHLAQILENTDVDLFYNADNELKPEIFEKIKTVIVDLNSAMDYVKGTGKFMEYDNGLLRWIVSQPWATTELINTMILHKDSYKASLDLELILHEKATFECVTSLDIGKFHLSHPLIHSVFDRIVEIIGTIDTEKFYEYLISLEMDHGNRYDTPDHMLKHTMMSLAECFLPAGEFFAKLSPKYYNSGYSILRKPKLILIYLETFGAQMNEQDLDNLISFAYKSDVCNLLENPLIWNEIAEKILRVSFNMGQTLVHMAKFGDYFSIFSQVQDMTNYISHLAVLSFEQTITDLKQAHLNRGKFIQKFPKLGKYENVFLMLTDLSVPRIFHLSAESLDLSCVFMMIEKRLVPLETAHIAFEHLTYNARHEIRSFSEDLGRALTKFIESFDGFEEEFVHICSVISNNNPSLWYYKALFELVGELQGDFRKCLTRNIPVFVFQQDLESIDRPYMYCLTAMMEMDWFTPSRLANILEFGDSKMLYTDDHELKPEIFEKVKTLIVDLNSAMEYIDGTDLFMVSDNFLLRWIVSQPWATSDLINALILHDDSDETSLDLELILHEKATFECVTSLNINKFKLSSALIPSVFDRIIEIITRDLNFGAQSDIQKFHAYLMSLEYLLENKDRTADLLLKHVLASFPECFLPAQEFFPRIFPKYKYLDESLPRQPKLILFYLETFGTQMNELDLDHLITFAFKAGLWSSRRKTLIWTEIAEKILGISFNLGQNPVHMSKSGNSPSVFGEFQYATNHTSHHFVITFEQKITELKQVQSNREIFMQLCPRLGKYEKVFLMLTETSVSEIFQLISKSMDPRYIFMEAVTSIIANSERQRCNGNFLPFKWN